MIPPECLLCVSLFLSVGQQQAQISSSLLFATEHESDDEDVICGCCCDCNCDCNCECDDDDVVVVVFIDGVDDNVCTSKRGKVRMEVDAVLSLITLALLLLLL